MNNAIFGFLDRNLPQFKNDIIVNIKEQAYDEYTVYFSDDKLVVDATSVIAACNGIYEYLKKYCNVQLSWCSNTTIDIDKLAKFDGRLNKRIEQKYRVYMNYCTLDYTMCWWDFSRWEKEIDFMAMNGINMPLAVIGTEAVWYEALIELGFTDEEALSTISGPAFWAWQLMTNIEGYFPPKNKEYVYERLELGKRILSRFLELGMYPIQQGFSGHVPVLLKKKYPKAKILMQKGWCNYPKTAQLDPLDDLFMTFGRTYLKKLDELLGAHHFIACDPFHEGTPPKNSKKYLNAVGKRIDQLYREFDANSVWVMQAWTMRKDIVCAVPKNRLLLLDLDSDRATKDNDYLWGYDIVCGMLHNFGGKNAMQGRLRHHSENNYHRLKECGASVVGSGMFMEGIEQNPVIYDLQFTMLTEADKIDFDSWLDSYISRRYGTITPELKSVWTILLDTCYRSDGYEENRVGSTLAARPQLMPIMTGPCCYTKVHYDTAKLEKAVELMLSISDAFKDVDAYQYDLCDMLRQALSNRFYTQQLEFEGAYNKKDLTSLKELSTRQLELLLDIDEYISHREEMTLSRWINMAHSLATNDEERKYFDLNARLLITLWGDVRTDTTHLFDYSWREWSGLIKEYYYPRWSIFYSEVIKSLERNKKPRLIKDMGNGFIQRKKYRSYPIGKIIDEFENGWYKSYSEYDQPKTTDVIPTSIALVKKWNI